MKGIGLLSLGRFSSVLVSLVSTAVLARLLSPADFGVFAASLLVVGLATALFEGAFAVGVVQRQSADADYVSSAFWLSILLSLSLIAVIWLAAPSLASFLNLEDGRAVVIVSSFSLLFKSAENVCVAYMRRTSKFARISACQFFGALLGGGLVALYLAWRGYGAWSLIYGQLATSAFTAIGSFACSKLPLRFALTRAAATDTLRTSGHFAFVHVLNWFAMAGSNGVIAHSLGMGPLGLYSRSWKLLDVAIRVSGDPLSSVLMPAFARMQDDRAKARLALERALNIALPLFAMLSVMAVLHAEAMVAIALGPQWHEATPIVQILFCVLIARSCYKVTESVAMGFGRGMATTLRQGVYAVLMIGGAVLTVPLGPNWVAANASLAAGLFYLTSLFYAARLVELRFKTLFALHLRAALPAALVCAADLSAAALFAHDRFWTGQSAGIAAGMAVFCIYCGLAPDRVVGPDLMKLRKRFTTKLAPQAS